MSEILGYLAVLGVMLTGLLAWLGGRHADNKTKALAKALGDDYVTRAKQAALGRLDAARAKAEGQQKDAETKAKKESTDAASVTDLFDYLNRRGPGPR